MATFKEAFASARKAGKKSFKWNGGTYHTKTKEEVAGNGPKPRPTNGKIMSAVASKSTGPKPRPSKKDAPAAKKFSGDFPQVRKVMDKMKPDQDKRDLEKAANQAAARRRLMEKGFAKGGMAKKD